MVGTKRTLDNIDAAHLWSMVFDILFSQGWMDLTTLKTLSTVSKTMRTIVFSSSSFNRLFTFNCALYFKVQKSLSPNIKVIFPNGLKHLRIHPCMDYPHGFKPVKAFFSKFSSISVFEVWENAWSKSFLHFNLFFMKPFLHFETHLEVILHFSACKKVSTSATLTSIYEATDSLFNISKLVLVFDYLEIPMVEWGESNRSREANPSAFNPKCLIQIVVPGFRPLSYHFYPLAYYLKMHLKDKEPRVEFGGSL